MRTARSPRLGMSLPAAFRAGGGLYPLLAYILFAVLLVLVGSTFEDYGATWDEPIQNVYGHFVLSYYLTGGADDNALHFVNLFYYGGLFDGVAAALTHFSPLADYETRHLLNALVGVIGVFGVWRLGTVLAGQRAGLIAALLLAAMPDYYGHMFNNPKDIPFAVGMIWSVYLGVLLVRELPRPAWSTAAKLGLAIGLTLGTRVGGVLAFAYLAAGLTAYAGLRVWQDRALLPLAGDVVRRIAPRLLAMVAVAYGVMLLCWPWAQQDPLANPVRALEMFSRFPWSGPVPVNGHMFRSTNLPWYYLPLFLVVKTPELPLFGVMAGLALAAAKGVRRWTRRAAAGGTPALGVSTALPFRPEWAVPVTALVLPLGYAMVARPVMYDGMRHFLFLLPVVATLAAVGLEMVIRSLAATRMAVRGGALAVVAGYVTVHLWVMIGLHPNQYIYFNALVGGVPGAAGRFDIDYWGNSLAEAADRLEDYVETVDGPSATERPMRVAVCGPVDALDTELPGDWAAVPAAEPADFLVVLVRFPCPHHENAPVVAEVERSGITLSYVRDLRAMTVRLRPPSEDIVAHAELPPSEGEPPPGESAVDDPAVCFDCLGPLAMDSTGAEPRAQRRILEY